jgi:hypothetical protein
LLAKQVLFVNSVSFEDVMRGLAHIPCWFGRDRIRDQIPDQIDLQFNRQRACRYKEWNWLSNRKMHILHRL